MKKKGIIITASGKNSFTMEQVARLESCLDVTFQAQLTPVTREEWVNLATSAEILAVTRRPIKNIDGEMIDALPGLKGLAIYSTGYEWVDVGALSQRGILLSFLPDYSTISVAEHTLAVLLSMSRRVHLTHDKSRGMVPDWVSLRGTELRGKRLGIVGLGMIGSEVARLASAFGMEIVYYDIRPVESTLARRVDYDELLQTADFVALTCSKERDGAPIITARELGLMKAGAYLINTARADLVDNDAIIAAVQSKHLAGYAVDDTLPILNTADLEPGRILQTGHTAWYSTEAIARGTEEWVNNIIALALDQPTNIVTGVVA